MTNVRIIASGKFASPGEANVSAQGFMLLLISLLQLAGQSVSLDYEGAGADTNGMGQLRLITTTTP